MSVMIVNISHLKILTLFSMTSPVLVAIIITVTKVIKFWRVLLGFLRLVCENKLLELNNVFKTLGNPEVKLTVFYSQ